jgi:glycerophosphoryl diester phosphodiesterase
MGKKTQQSVDHDLREYVKIKPSYPELDEVNAKLAQLPTHEEVDEKILTVNTGGEIDLSYKADKVFVDELDKRSIKHSETTWHNLPTPNYISHRGEEACAPENTFAAFDLSAQHRFPIGMDLFETKDHVLVCRHDDDLSTRSDAVGLVTNSLYPSFSSASAGDWFSKNYESERIPTFEEVLNKYGGKHLIMAQVYGNQGTAYETIANLITNKKLEPYVLIEVNYTEDMNKLHAINPNILVCITSSQQSVVGSEFDNAFMVNWSASTITQAGIDEAKGRGLKVQAYGVNTKQRANELISMGVDFINSSDPLYYKGGITFETPFHLPIGKGNVGSYWEYYQSTGAPYVNDYFLGYIREPAPSPYSKSFLGYTTKLNDVISFDLKFVDATTSGLYVNMLVVPDSPNWNKSVSGSSNKNLFYLQIYASGRIIVYDVVDGTITKKGDDSTAFTPFVDNEVKQLSVKLNSSSITITTPDKTYDVSLTVTQGHIVPRFGTSVKAGIARIKVENNG